MKLAIMQPYFLPYFGYCQLIAAADKFVIYDDVQFIRRGWINRNRILVDGAAHLFTVPIKKAPRDALIHEIELDAENFPKWRGQFLKTVQHAYQRAPYFEETFMLLKGILGDSPGRLAELIYRSLETIISLLEIDSEIIRTSRQYDNARLRAQDRILDICAKENADIYINAVGGRALYRGEDFAAQGIELKFLSPQSLEYPQFRHDFVPNLSVLDVLMFNSIGDARANLGSVDWL